MKDIDAVRFEMRDTAARLKDHDIAIAQTIDGWADDLDGVVVDANEAARGIEEWRDALHTRLVVIEIERDSLLVQLEAAIARCAACQREMEIAQRDGERLRVALAGLLTMMVEGEASYDAQGNEWPEIAEARAALAAGEEKIS